MSSTLAEIRAANEAGASPPNAGTFVIYNFPDRDCSASASAGELVIAEGGVEAYKSEYIDPIVELVKEYADVRIIFVFGETFICPVYIPLYMTRGSVGYLPNTDMFFQNRTA